jgi:DNA-directed RNA polymerase specialized sigma24 family protein
MGLLEILTPDQTEAVTRYFVDGISMPDIARERRTSKQATHKLIAKAKRRLARAGLPIPKRTNPHAGHARNMDESTYREL